MKVHRLLVDQLAKALKDIFSSRRRADKVIEYYLKQNRKWGARDRRFFAESAYDLVRWWRLYWSLAGFKDADHRDGEAMTLEEIRIVWAAYWLEKNKEKLDWIEFDHFDLAELAARRGKIKSQALLASFPDELYRIGEKEWGAHWPGIVDSLNKPADVYLRTNTLKTTPEELVERLRKEDVVAQRASRNPTALRLPERKNVFITEAFKEGLFEVQDLGSQEIATFLDPQPGERVVDACAGAGGKTLHMASLMKNKGKIIALDIHEKKLEELKKRVRRNGVNIVEAKIIDSTKVIKRLEASADRVLLDVPCSGMGVLRRNPDTKWQITATELKELQILQADILENYCKMTKPGGTLVYATCSLLPSENEAQVEKFLKAHPEEWALEKQFLLRPDQAPTDGFFAAKLRRKA